MEEVDSLLTTIRRFEEKIESEKNYIKSLMRSGNSREDIERWVNTTKFEIGNYEREIDWAIERLSSIFHRDIDIYERTRGSRRRGKGRINYRRKVFCVYRLYKQNVPLEIIARMLACNDIRRDIRRVIGEAFKDQCLKNSCWATPFLLDPREKQQIQIETSLTL